MKKVVNDLSGLSYVALTSEKSEEPVKKHNTLGEGLGISAGFLMCMLAIVIAM